VRARRKEVDDLQATLAEARQRIALLERELEARRTRDPITGLPILDVLSQRLGPEIERSRRHGRPLTVAVVDVDGFRAINAHYGRRTGDRVLEAIGETLDGLPARATSSADPRPTSSS
jgi:GGDEF domain-containing protein